MRLIKLLQVTMLINFFSLVQVSIADAQTFYELRYSFETEKFRRTYRALMVRHADGTGFMVTRLNSRSANASNPVRIYFEETYKTDAAGRPDTNVVVLTPVKSELNDLTPNATFKKDGKNIIEERMFNDTLLDYLKYKGNLLQLRRSGNFFSPDTIFSPYGTDSDVGPSRASLLNITDTAYFTKTILQYISVDDPFYKGLNFAKLKATFDQSLTVNLSPGAPKMHLILVANTNDISIGSTCAMDMKSVQDYFKQVAKFLKIQFLPKLISGKNYSRKNVEAAVNTLRPGANDIVVFYYTGHGFNEQKENYSFPYLDLRSQSSQPYGGSNAMNMESIYNAIKSKKARLNLLFSDCCNAAPGSASTLIPNVATTRSVSLGWNEAYCKKLFLESKQTIMMTAAQKGQLAAGNNNIGGIFTFSLCSSFEKYLSPVTPSVSWNEVLANVKNQTSRKASNTLCPGDDDTFKPCEQVPVFKVE